MIEQLAFVLVLAAGSLVACGRFNFDLTHDGGTPDADVDAGDCLLLPMTDAEYCGALVLATGQSFPYGIALTSTDVLWINAGDGFLSSCPKTGCGAGPTRLARGAGAGYFVAADATHVYWNFNDIGELLRCPLAGCPGLVPEVLASVPAATYVAIDTTYIYTTTNLGSLVRVLKTGGAPFDLVTGLSDPNGIAISGGAMLLAHKGTAHLASVPLTGGPATPIVTGQAGIQVVAANASQLVWATSTAIMTSDLAGGNVQMVAAAEQPGGLVLDATHIYWTNTTGTTVVKAPLAGGPSTVIATGVASPGVLAVDGQYVYFTGFDDGMIYRVPR